MYKIFGLAIFVSSIIAESQFIAFDGAQQLDASPINLDY